MVEDFARHPIVQRKLNEAEPRFGLPRKQFTAVYRALTSPLNSWQLADAARFAGAHRHEIQALSSDPHLAPVLEHLRECEVQMHRGKRRLVTSRLRYRWHSLRRRRASAFQHALFGLFEVSGRVIADMRNPFHVKRVTPAIVAELGDILRPGDAIVTRHDDAMSNLFLPGYWIHSSLHIGTEEDRRRLRVKIDPMRQMKWTDPIRVLEARKDGVRLRALHDTLSVDAVAVIRPRLAESFVAEALSRALTHEGKMYDFEFDFFRSDRLVCSEVVYRGFHGVGGLEFALTRRAGRPTFSSEDLLRMAVEGKGYDAVAAFGAPECETHIARHAAAHEVISRTLRT
jgi:hypothetical protein